MPESSETGLAGFKCKDHLLSDCFKICSLFKPRTSDWEFEGRVYKRKIYEIGGGNCRFEREQMFQWAGR